ncbi:MAG TPA: pyruvate kinase, partial [Candidatus Omnitrophica bacterium]|nr:pyruvate kinase [Candidatus Omnitrophota bacterium]
MSRVKLVATIGPVTDTEGAIQALVQAGMDVARLNGSHGDMDWHAGTIKRLRATAPQLPILLDLPGSKIRTMNLGYEPRVALGDRVVLTSDSGHDGRVKVPISDAGLHDTLAPGDTILADEGQLRLTVQEVVGQDIACRAETTGTLRSRQGLYIPMASSRPTVVTEADRAMVEFAKAHEVDFVGISDAQSADHVTMVREAIGRPAPRIIAKIESQRALEQAKPILEASDGIMIDRGDLCLDTGPHNVALLQKQLIAAARDAGRPAIVATEMLHSMMTSPVPTKAEISDITNAVLDGAAAVMLSGETAVGRFPIEAVSTMRGIADAAATHLQSVLDHDETQDRFSIPQAMEDAIALICRQLPVTKIVAITRFGYAARMVAARMPRQSILAVSDDPAAARSFQLLPGTEGVAVDIPFSRTSLDHIPKCLEALWQCGKLVDRDLVLVTAVGYPRSGNRMNL